MHWMKGAIGGLRGGGFPGFKSTSDAWAKREQLGQYSPYFQVKYKKKNWDRPCIAFASTLHISQNGGEIHDPCNRRLL
jgi:hypothetical protein